MSVKIAPSARILIVEDEPLVAMLLEDMVVDAGYTAAASVSTIAQALAFARDKADQFDIAILDVNLSGQPSFPIAEALAGQGKPFVFATGYGSAGLPVEWRDRPTLQKPFGGAEVEKALSSMLATV